MAISARTIPIQGLSSSLRAAISRICVVDGVSGAFVASRDGLLVAGDDGSSDCDTKAALAAAVLGAIDRAAPNMGIGTVRATLVETASHCLQVLCLGDLLLVVTASKQANMALIRAAMAGAAQEISLI